MSSRVPSAVECPGWEGMAHMSPWRVQLDLNVPRPRAEGIEFQVLLHFSEPPQLLASREAVLAAAASYQLILTYDEGLLTALPQAVFFPFGEAWLPRALEPLQPGVSFVFSEGASQSIVLPGYDERAAILQALAQPGAPPVSVFYGVQRPMRASSWALLDALAAAGRKAIALSPDRAAKSVAFTYQSQIVIENVRVRSYFTEKIVDCFARGVTPIYVGCPNIGDFFDARGIVQCVNAEHAIECAAALLDGRLAPHPDALATNFALADTFVDVPRRVRHIVSYNALRKFAFG